MIIDYSPYFLAEINMVPIEKINPLYNPHITKSYSKKWILLLNI